MNQISATWLPLSQVSSCYSTGYLGRSMTKSAVTIAAS